jgi:dephospho-CoA kinase
MLRVGLTGGIGCGKSVVADAFVELGAAVVDTDVISHRLTAPGGAALANIHQHFGDTVFHTDGALDRAALRQRVFSDTAERTRLEAIVHPLILNEVRRALDALHGVPYVLVVIPLLAERQQYGDLLDRVLVIDCREAQQISRVAARSGLAVAEIEAIIAAQASRAERLALADDVLVNDGECSERLPQIAELHRRYQTLSAKAL